MQGNMRSDPKSKNSDRIGSGSDLSNILMIRGHLYFYFNYLSVLPTIQFPSKWQFFFPVYFVYFINRFKYFVMWNFFILVSLFTHLSFNDSVQYEKWSENIFFSRMYIVYSVSVSKEIQNVIHILLKEMYQKKRKKNQAIKQKKGERKKERKIEK